LAPSTGNYNYSQYPPPSGSVDPPPSGSVYPPPPNMAYPPPDQNNGQPPVYTGTPMKHWKGFHPCIVGTNRFCKIILLHK
jgi:hypothetical protein